eukprot:1172388-Pleurochrysis_carterae.AAC.1
MAAHVAMPPLRRTAMIFATMCAASASFPTTPMKRLSLMVCWISKQQAWWVLRTDMPWMCLMYLWH